MGGTSSAAAPFFPWALHVHSSLTFGSCSMTASDHRGFCTALSQRTTQTENSRLDSWKMDNPQQPGVPYHDFGPQSLFFFCSLRLWVSWEVPLPLPHQAVPLLQSHQTGEELVPLNTDSGQISLLHMAFPLHNPTAASQPVPHTLSPQSNWSLQSHPYG